MLAKRVFCTNFSSNCFNQGQNFDPLWWNRALNIVSTRGFRWLSSMHRVLQCHHYLPLEIKFFTYFLLTYSQDRTQCIRWDLCWRVTRRPATVHSRTTHVAVSVSYFTRDHRPFLFACKQMSVGPTYRGHRAGSWRLQPPLIRRPPTCFRRTRFRFRCRTIRREWRRLLERDSVPSSWTLQSKKKENDMLSFFSASRDYRLGWRMTFARRCSAPPPTSVHASTAGRRSRWPT